MDAVSASSSGRLLIVDDIADNRAMLGRRLGRRGYEIVEAGGGLEALRLIAEQGFDLVLLDIMMPDLSGLEVLRQIRTRRSAGELPIVIVTAKVQDEDVVEAISLGANDYLTKPVRFEVALARIEALTARKRADEALRNAAAELELISLQLRHERDFLQDVFDHLDKGIALRDGGRLLAANHRLLELLRIPTSECPVGGDFRRVLGPAASERLGLSPEGAAFLARAVSWFDQDGAARTEIIRPDGRVLELSRHLAANGKQLNVVSDITERAHASERVRQSQKMEALGELAGGVAHEFNNLLQVIGGFTQTAINRLDGASEARTALEEVLAASGRASDLSRQMLTFSRNWVGQGKVLAVDQELAQVNRLMSFDSRGIRLELSVEPDLRVTLDKTNFSQAILNLAINARDAMSRGGLLSIQARRRVVDTPLSSSVDPGCVLPPGDYVQIAVADQGEGVPPHLLPRIFEPFFSTKTAGKGTGLGLSFVFGVVKQAGGVIDVASTPGEGSTFTIHLPLSSKPVSVEARDTAYAGGHETILVVDDESQVRAVTATLLEGLGYTVVQASGGLEALQLFDDRRDAIDLVLTDIAMPDMDGFDLAGLLREIGCATPIVFMTGCVPDLEHQDHRFVSAGGPIIQKPFGVKTLAVFTRDALQEEAA